MRRIDWQGLSFDEGTREGHRWADVVAIHDEVRAEAEVWDRLGGWIVSVPEDLGRRLVDAGAHLRRHAHCMTRDLVADPPPAFWATPAVPAPLVVTKWRHHAADLLVAHRLAYPPGHPDHLEVDDARLVHDDLGPLIAGEVIGPLMRCSGVVEDDGRVVAACLVNDREGEPPLGGPWIGDVFRHSDPAYAGLGTLLLRRALARAARDGVRAIGLAVSEGNPARRVYEGLGFTLTDSSITVLIPENA